MIQSTIVCSFHLEPPSKITDQVHDLGVSLNLLPASITSFPSSLGMPSALIKILSPTTIGFLVATRFTASSSDSGLVKSVPPKETLAPHYHQILDSLTSFTTLS
ncbi:hypothetical protein QL285_013972 [Trifolium repens]|nr:hypothetical protein QL285_013972 [Trifolium repens]